MIINLRCSNNLEKCVPNSAFGIANYNFSETSFLLYRIAGIDILLLEFPDLSGIAKKTEN